MTDLPVSWTRGQEPPYDAWWASVAPDVRAEAVACLRAEFSPDTVKQVRQWIAEHGPHEWVHKAIQLTPEQAAEYAEVGLANPDTRYLSAHHGWGTGVRNALREAGITDDRLPQVRYGEDLIDGNWDDFYVAAVEEAVAAPEYRLPSVFIPAPKCDCTRGCVNRPDPEGPYPEMCSQCQGTHCTSHEMVRHDAAVEAGFEDYRYAGIEGEDTRVMVPALDLSDKCDDPDCVCKYVIAEGEAFCMRQHRVKAHAISNQYLADQAARNVDAYLLVTREVKPSGWSPKMLWARLVRKNLTVYLEPREPWTVDQLVDALAEADERGINIEVYVRMNLSDPSKEN